MTRHCAVNPQGFPTCCRMDADQRMRTFDILWSCCGIFAIEVWMGTAVDSLSSVDDLPEFWGELLVGCVA
jgi:hypothetical protein